MNIILVSHPSRAAHVHALQQKLPVVTTVVDTVNALSGHRTALRLALSHGERVVIMEDDAIPVEGMPELARGWCDAYPDVLISFYLGTSRPRDYQTMVADRIKKADSFGDDLIWLPTLIHGVCYSIPTWAIPGVLTRMDQLSRIKEADFAIGAAWGAPVCYPLESLVQHRDEAPVERHPDGQARIEPRVARRLAAPLMFNS